MSELDGGEGLKDRMEKMRSDAAVIVAWPEDWLVKVLRTGGKDIRAIRDALNRAISGEDLVNPTAACEAVLRDLSPEETKQVLWNAFDVAQLTDILAYLQDLTHSIREHDRGS